MMTKAFDKDIINECLHQFLVKNKVAKLSLVHDEYYSHYQHYLSYFGICDSQHMYQVKRGAPYQLSVVHAIWETQFLIDLIDKYIHPWAIEKGENTERIVLVPKHKMTDCITAVRHQPGYGPDRFRQDLIPPHTLEELKKHNMLERWGI